MPQLKIFTTGSLSHQHHLNFWDLLAFMFMLALFVFLAWGVHQIAQPYPFVTGHIVLDPSMLPYYAWRSVLRMLVALFCSLCFTFMVGTLAAKHKTAGLFIIPAIDVLQSIPPLGFLSLAVVALTELFAGSSLGPECASIFTIFTAQVWNMVLSFYQSLRTVPKELQEASSIFRLSRWQCFWRVEVPLATPHLLWNTMMSMSASWFFVVASEAVTIAHQNIALPGIGSYIALAIQQSNLRAMGYAIATMLLVILLYDQLLFRPMLFWSEKFKFTTLDHEDDKLNKSWVISLFQRTRLTKHMAKMIRRFLYALISRRCEVGYSSINRLPLPIFRWISWIFRGSFYVLGALMLCWVVFCLLQSWHFLSTENHFSQLKHMVYLGAITALRVNILVLISCLVWGPVGVWIGMHPKWVAWVQPTVQFLAAFPANLMFPLVALGIARYHLNPEIWISPLMILGTQWYVLFNVVAGMRSLPEEMFQVMLLFQVRGWSWWRRFIFPGIAPCLITGAMAAAGGAWNASIIAESVSWGATHLKVTGLGAYMTEVAYQGDFTQLNLGIVVMCGCVLVTNGLVWQPLYRMIQRRFH